MFLFAPIRWALRLSSLVVLGAIVYVVVSGVQVYQASRTSSAIDAVPAASAIVVIGTPIAGSQPSADLAGRLEQALLLYEGHRAPTILVTGMPASASSAPVPEVARRWLVAQGVPSAAVIPVSASTPASGLALATSELGTRRDVIVVTDAMDTLWAKDAATQAGLAPELSPVSGSARGLLGEFGPLWREATGVALGRIIGYGRVPWAEG